MKINNHKRYLAHSPNQFGKADLLSAHLQDVASRAAEYAGVFGAADEARAAGLLSQNRIEKA